MKPLKIDQKYLEALDQIRRGLAIRVGPFLGRIEDIGVIVEDCLVAQFATTTFFDVLLVALDDVDPETFNWEDQPQTEWTVRLDRDFDLDEVIEVLSDHVISHLERRGLR